MHRNDLITDLATIKRLAEAEDDENIRFRQFVKYNLPCSERRLDTLVHRIAREVAAAIDCTQCANCCRELEVSLRDEDIAGLAAHLGCRGWEVEAKYAAPGEHCARTFKNSPCAFLRDNRCSVYSARPRDCREFPHLDKPDFSQRMWQLLSNADLCPIVFNVLRRLKRELWRRE